MKVIEGKQGIGPLWGRVAEAIRGQVRIAPSAYDQLAYNLGGGSSDNWDETFVAIDLLNIWRKQDHVNALAELAEFLRVKLVNKRFGQKEFGSWEYLSLHTAPTILQCVLARKFAAQDPATWVPIAAGLREWLRALVGWLAVTGCWGPGKTWTDKVAKSGPGARLLVGTGDYFKRIGGATYSVFCGKRSFEMYKGKWRLAYAAPMYLSDLGLGVRPKKGDVAVGHRNFMKAVESLAGGPLDILSASERALVLAATRNDVSALQWCVTELIRDWLPAEPVVIVRTDHGVSCTMLEAGGSPTATMYHSGWDDDGTTYACGADDGLRGGHAEHVEPGRAEIDIAARTGWCQRTKGEPRPRIEFPLPKGALVAVLEAQFGVGIKARYYRNGVEIVPAPPIIVPGPGPIAPPKPTATKKNHTPLIIGGVIVAIVILSWLFG